MRLTVKQWTKALQAIVEEQGGTATFGVARNSHLIVTATFPDGAVVLQAERSPGDHRAANNFRTRLRHRMRKAGLL